MDDVAVREMQQKNRGAEQQNRVGHGWDEASYGNARAYSGSIFTAATGQGTAVRVLSLLLAPALAFGVVAVAGGIAGSAAMLVWAIWIACGVGFYFLPTYEANLRRQPNMTSIVVLNVFLGWTLVGWVVAMVWGCADRQSSSEAPRTYSHNQPAVNMPSREPSSRRVFGPITEPVKQAEPDIQPVVVPPATVTSVADELRKLADLKEQGILTEEEFGEQKLKLMSR